MKRLLTLVLVLFACGPVEDRFTRSAPFKPGMLKIYLAFDRPFEGREQAVIAESSQVIYLSASPELTEAHLEKVAVRNGRNDDKIVVLTFNKNGTARLAHVTSENIGKRLAFAIGEKIVMAPLIQGKITEGEAVIEGGYSRRDAEELAKRLSGS